MTTPSFSQSSNTPSSNPLPGYKEGQSLQCQNALPGQRITGDATLHHQTGTVLATQIRGQEIENTHTGWAVVVDSQGAMVHSTLGAAQQLTFFRSAAKPFQAIPLLHRLGGNGLTSEQWALACASHSGRPEHTAIVEQLLAKAGLSIDDLQCGSHEPIDPDARRQLVESGRCPSCLHHNCSGKHAAKLLMCHASGWETATYLEMDHPLQQAIVATVQEWGDLAELPERAVDGCGAPVFYLPMTTMAMMYARLGQSDEARPLVEAMVTHPELVGGIGHADSTLMEASEGQLLAKVGADGVLAIAHRPRRLGFFLKMADGNNEIRNIVAVQLLAQLGWLAETVTRPQMMERLSPWLSPQRLNNQGVVIGHTQVYAPWM